MSRAAVVVPWHTPAVLEQFLREWGIEDTKPDWLILEQDIDRSGCAVTKNRGVERARNEGYEIAVVLDSDCFPSQTGAKAVGTLEALMAAHLECMEPQEFPVFEVMTEPIARGVPHFNRTIKLPVAASVGWWTGIPDRCAARQLIEGAETAMRYEPRVIYNRVAMICGMNMAIRTDWFPWTQLINVSRMDDVFFSWLFCKEAARRHHCINFNGPTIRHARQSNIWASLRDEAVWLEKNETLWSDIWLHPATDYATLRALVPVP